jgi:cell division protein ZapA (FtsZ GTPase activity inhibitor)
MGPPGDRKTVRVNIYNQPYTLVASGDPAEVEDAARKVDTLMHEYARALNVDTARAAVLACLDLAANVQTLERQVAEMKRRFDSKTRELNELLDRAIG